MNTLAAMLAIAAAAFGVGPATITTPDGWILPDTGNVTRCVHDDDNVREPLTLCTDTVTGQRYLNGQPVYR